MNNKEFAKQLRENVITDDYGIVLCSPQLWEIICRTIERTPDETNEYINNIKSIV